MNRISLKKGGENIISYGNIDRLFMKSISIPDKCKDCQFEDAFECYLYDKLIPSESIKPSFCKAGLVIVVELGDKEE